MLPGGDEQENGQLKRNRLVVGVGKIDLSPAAKSHCTSLSDWEHYSQSPWINPTAASHNLSRRPPDKLSHSQAVHDGRASRTLHIKPSPLSHGCLRICFARKVLLIG